jgi:hypothetical protein
MTSKLNMHDSAAEALSHMPAWVTSARAQGPEDVAFLSGAALATLQHVLGRQDMPQTLLRALGVVCSRGLRGLFGPSRTGRGSTRRGALAATWRFTRASRRGLPVLAARGRTACLNQGAAPGFANAVAR